MSHESLNPEDYLRGTAMDARTAFEIYHLHGASAIGSLAKELGHTEAFVMEEIAKFGSSLTAPYQIMSSKGVVIKTVDPVPTVDNSFEFTQLKLHVTRNSVDPALMRTDAEGRIGVKVGSSISRVNPDAFFDNLSASSCTKGVDVEVLMAKAIMLPYYTDEEIHREFVRRNLSL